MTCRWLALLLLPLFACGEDQPMPAGHTPPPPATTGGPVLTSDDSTTAAASQCACAPDQFCAADYVPGQPAPAPEAFTCHAGECLAAGSPGFWCFDDSSCCDGSCRCDGVCGVPIDESECAATSTTDATTDASTTGSTTDASTTGSTTDASTTGSTTDATGGSSATGSSTG